ncbi:MAG: hypothetical protein Q7T05_05135 [Dehalococcoidia bacterium]|nr:hypothetical protein [Dehalococcoidia bacterium]
MAAKDKKAPAAKRAEPGRSIIYKDVEAVIWDKDHESGPITLQVAKDLLNWESEKGYQARFKAANPDSKKVPDYGDGYLFKDQLGQKIRCWNNDRNRPFDEAHARKLAQDILNRNWAGPTTLEGETVNGEAIIVGRTGLIESGQHRLIGFVLACEMWEAEPHWKDTWEEMPVLESVVVKGVSESSSVIQTLDNVKPRALSDVFFTTETFSKLDPKGKKECSRMLEAAVNLLWTRTGAAESQFHKYQTHSESADFLARHGKLLKCVKHLYEENSDRAISNLRLSAGACSALIYLQGAGASDGDKYRSREPHVEKDADWSLWDKANDFWAEIAGDSAGVKPVRDAIGLLVDDETLTGGRQREKFAILAKAWQSYKEGQKIKPDDLTLEYKPDDNGVLQMVGTYSFDGIDQGDKPVKVAEPEPTKEEVEAAKKAKRQELANKILAAKKTGQATEGLTPAGEEAAKANGESPKKTPPVPRKKAETISEAQTRKCREYDEADARAKADSLAAGGQDEIPMGVPAE